MLKPVRYASLLLNEICCSDQWSAQIMLLREVLEADPKDRIIQLCAKTVLGLCLQCTTAKMGVEYVNLLPNMCGPS